MTSRIQALNLVPSVPVDPAYAYQPFPDFICHAYTVRAGESLLPVAWRRLLAHYVVDNPQASVDYFVISEAMLLEMFASELPIQRLSEPRLLTERRRVTDDELSRYSTYLIRGTKVIVHPEMHSSLVYVLLRRQVATLDDSEALHFLSNETEHLAAKPPIKYVAPTWNDAPNQLALIKKLVANILAVPVELLGIADDGHKLTVTYRELA